MMEEYFQKLKLKTLFETILNNLVLKISKDSALKKYFFLHHHAYKETEVCVKKQKYNHH